MKKQRGTEDDCETRHELLTPVELQLLTGLLGLPEGLAERRGGMVEHEDGVLQGSVLALHPLDLLVQVAALLLELLLLLSRLTGTIGGRHEHGSSERCRRRGCGALPLLTLVMK